MTLQKISSNHSLWPPTVIKNILGKKRKNFLRSPVLFCNNPPPRPSSTSNSPPPFYPKRSSSFQNKIVIMILMIRLTGKLLDGQFFFSDAIMNYDWLPSQVTILLEKSNSAGSENPLWFFSRCPRWQTWYNSIFLIILSVIISLVEIHTIFFFPFPLILKLMVIYNDIDAIPYYY